ncbi:hypothetical protein RM572_05465 [Streptomyces sp. DSM 42041]|uniref:Uncharacterized protein n=1 Tax=Streptomyces hazeniae TaxID=3075538 RepID=A0ABU2NMP4_9ACTN|nr:hypothetical protein [Streptomyces sp. DSM 42041]MDT0378226.1 hypothetical protein [Streptomyces sp. DSM 42041]
MSATSPDGAEPTVTRCPDRPAAEDGLRLRDAAAGEMLLPYVAGVVAADGTCVPVPVESADRHADGGLTLHGSAVGFSATLRLGPPAATGADGSAAPGFRRDGEAPPATAPSETSGLRTGPAGAAQATVREAELTVSRSADEPRDAGLRVEVRLGATDDPGWLIPGVFYGENRLPACERPYPRYAPGAHDPQGMVADAWSFRADRCATPAVFARDTRGGAALALDTEQGELGEQGVGFALLPGDRPALRLHAPYREEPVSYYGSAEPRPVQAPQHTWQPGHTRTVRFTLHLLDADPHAYAPVLRALHRRTPAPERPAAWVGLDEAAGLSAYGLHRWHYRPDPPVLLETAAFDREALGERGDRTAMHVSWVSGTPYAHAMLLHARRTGDRALAGAAIGVLDHIAANLAPGGTFWGQWGLNGGWNAGWTPDRNRLHARTLGDATLFLLRALRAERALGHDHPAWEYAVRSNLTVARAGLRETDGRPAAAHHSDTGAALSHEGSAGLAWIAPWTEAADAFGEPEWRDAARRAGAAYAADVRAEFLCGAPEDVSLAPTSEDGYNAVIAYTLLHEADPGDPRWLDLARRAADWTLTFRYTYDVTFGPHTLLGRYGFRTRGGDQASPSNQHLHAFGLICLPETVRLARHLGDPYYLDSARENLDCFRQFVARADGDFNAYRGMVSERFYQTECFQAKGMLLTLSHAWSAGVLLYACETARDLPELKELR